MNYRQFQFDAELRKMLAQAARNGKACLHVVSKKLHDRVVHSTDNRMPMACNAMWKLWREQGSHKHRIIHTTDSGKSSTIEIEFDTH